MSSRPHLALLAIRAMRLRFATRLILDYTREEKNHARGHPKSAMCERDNSKNPRILPFISGSQVLDMILLWGFNLAIGKKSLLNKDG